MPRRSEDGAVELGGWTRDGRRRRLAVEGDGSDADWWRVVATAGWRHLDAPGTLADVGDTTPPGPVRRPAPSRLAAMVSERAPEADAVGTARGSTGVAAVDEVLADVRGLDGRRWRSTSRCSSTPTSSCAAPSTPSRHGPDAAGRLTDRAPDDFGSTQELVRRGLARSREHASELIAAGRVKVSGAVATKPATGVTTDVAIVVREDPDARGLRLARRSQAGRRAGRLRRRTGVSVDGQALPRRRRLHRRVHRRPAARRRARGGGRGRRLRAARLVAAERRPGRGPRPHQHPRADARRRRRARSTWWSATCPSSPSSWSSTRCCR